MAQGQQLTHPPSLRNELILAVNWRLSLIGRGFADQEARHLGFMRWMFTNGRLGGPTDGSPSPS